MPGYRGNKKELPALSTFVKLLRATEAVSSEVHQGLGAHGLTISQFGVLEALYHLGPLCQRDLGRRILKSSGNITLVIDNLEKRGLVQRSRDPRDRRFLNVELTRSGKELIRTLFPVHAAGIESRLSVLSREEQKLLGRLLRKLKNGEDAANQHIQKGEEPSP